MKNFTEETIQGGTEIMLHEGLKREYDVVE